MVQKKKIRGETEEVVNIELKYCHYSGSGVTNAQRGSCSSSIGGSMP